MAPLPRQSQNQMCCCARQRGHEGAHRDEVAEELLRHVGLSQEGAHQQLLLPQAQPRAAVDVAVQVQPVRVGLHRGGRAAALHEMAWWWWAGRCGLVGSMASNMFCTMHCSSGRA